MAEKYRVNKEKCIGCGVCVATCNKATELGEDGKAKVINSEKLEQCGEKASAHTERLRKPKKKNNFF